MRALAAILSTALVVCGCNCGGPGGPDGGSDGGLDGGDGGVHCTGAQKLCQGGCIPLAACCLSSECSGGAVCDAGVCGCAPGYKGCNGVCIPAGECCYDTDCPSGKTCSAGNCNCPTGQQDCGGSCISASLCCPPVNVCGPSAYQDHTDGSTPIVSFPLSDGGRAYLPPCVTIRANQSVVFSGNFSLYPLSQSCGAAPVITNVSSGSSATFTFSDAGYYGYVCPSYVSVGMGGAVQVVP